MATELAPVRVEIQAVVPSLLWPVRVGPLCPDVRSLIKRPQERQTRQGQRTMM